MTHTLNAENTTSTSAQFDNIATTRAHTKFGYMRCTQANCERSSLLWMGIWSLLECLKSLAKVERIIVLSISSASVTQNLPGQFSLHQMTSAITIGLSSYFPLNPSINRHWAMVDKVTPRALLVLIPSMAVQQDTHIEHHSCFHCISQSGGTNNLTTTCTWHIVVTLLDIATSCMVFTKICFDDVIEVLL